MSVWLALFMTCIDWSQPHRLLYCLRSLGQKVQGWLVRQVSYALCIDQEASGVFVSYL